MEFISIVFYEKKTLYESELVINGIPLLPLKSLRIDKYPSNHKGLLNLIIKGDPTIIHDVKCKSELKVKWRVFVGPLEIIRFHKYLLSKSDQLMSI